MFPRIRDDDDSLGLRSHLTLRDWPPEQVAVTVAQPGWHHVPGDFVPALPSPVVSPPGHMRVYLLSSSP